MTEPENRNPSLVSHPLPVVPAPSWWTVEELARRFNVSAKTITRWRRYGLDGRCRTVGGRRRILFERQVVERFERDQGERIRRGSRFSQLSASERERIRTQARALADSGVSPPRLVERISRETGRSIEAVRNTLKRLDRESAARPVLGRRPAASGSVEQIYALYRRGTPVSELARALDRTPGGVHRLIARRRAAYLAKVSLDFMPSSEFERSDAAEVILGAMPPRRRSPAPVPPAGLPSYLASLYEVPLLTPDQERFLFRKYNYLKYRASQLRDTLDPARPHRRTLDEIERLVREAVRTKNRILRANLRLVVSVAKRFARDGDGLFDKISDGNVSLLRAVEKFDYSRGFRFSTYATWALRKNFARSFTVETKRRRRMGTAPESVLAAQTDPRSHPGRVGRAQSARERAVRRMLGQLTDREREIIRHRFGLNGRAEPMTYCQIGGQLGVSKERVRQLVGHALAKLRKAAANIGLDEWELGIE